MSSDTSTSPSTGVLLVETEPSGAMVFLDGEFTNALTDATLEGVPPGRHVVETRFDYYDETERPFRATVEVRAGQVARVRLDAATHAAAPEHRAPSNSEPVVFITEERPSPSPRVSNVARASAVECAPARALDVVRRPSVPQRMLATFIDSIVVSVAAGIAQVALCTVFVSAGSVVSSALAAAGWLLRDAAFGDGQSPGKKCMGYRVVGADGRPCGVEASVRRNALLAIPSIGGLAAGLAMLIPGFGPLGFLLLPLVHLAMLGVYALEIFLMCVDPRGERLGDRLAGTCAVTGPLGALLPALPGAEGKAGPAGLPS